MYSYEGEDQEEFAHVRGSLASSEDTDKYHRFQPKVSGSRPRGSKAFQSSTASHTAAPVAACMADRYEHSLNVMEHTVAPPEPMASKFPRIDASALDPPMDSKRLLVKRKRGVEPAEGIVLERRKRRKVSLLSAIENLSISEEPKPSRKRKFYKLEEPGERISAPSDFVAKRATDEPASATEEEMQGIPEEVLLMWKQHLHKTNPAEADASNYVVDVYVEQEPEDMEREMTNYRTMFVEEFPTDLLLQDEYDSDQIESDDPDGQEVDYPDEEDDIFLTSDEDGGYSSDARDTAYHSDYNNLETDEDEADSDDDGHRHGRSWWG